MKDFVKNSAAGLVALELNEERLPSYSYDGIWAVMTSRVFSSVAHFTFRKKWRKLLKKRNTIKMAVENSRFKIPEEVTERIPKSWGRGIPNKKGIGTRWADPKNKSARGVRIDKGDPNSRYRSQQVDHVIVRDNGKVLGRNGKPIDGSIKSDPSNAHIPLTEYRKWSSWNVK